MTFDWNSSTTLHAWVDETLDNAEGMDPAEVEKLRTYGHHLVESGCWRGDISEAWRNVVPRINMAMMNLYL